MLVLGRVLLKFRCWNSLVLGLGLIRSVRHSMYSDGYLLRLFLADRLCFKFLRLSVMLWWEDLGFSVRSICLML